MVSCMVVVRPGKISAGHFQRDSRPLVPHEELGYKGGWLFGSSLASYHKMHANFIKQCISSDMQGYGGGDTALGGGQTGGDAYTRDADQAAGQQQDSSFGGDQTNLDAGANTNYGVNFLPHCTWWHHAMPHPLHMHIMSSCGTGAQAVLSREFSVKIF